MTADGRGLRPHCFREAEVIRLVLVEHVHGEVKAGGRFNFIPDGYGKNS